MTKQTLVKIQAFTAFLLLFWVRTPFLHAEGSANYGLDENGITWTNTVWQGNSYQIVPGAVVVSEASTSQTSSVSSTALTFVPTTVVKKSKAKTVVTPVFKAPSISLPTTTRPAATVAPKFIRIHILPRPLKKISTPSQSNTRSKPASSVPISSGFPSLQKILRAEMPISHLNSLKSFIHVENFFSLVDAPTHTAAKKISPFSSTAFFGQIAGRKGAFAIILIFNLLFVLLVFVTFWLVHRFLHQKELAYKALSSKKIKTTSKSKRIARSSRRRI